MILNLHQGIPGLLRLLHQGGVGIQRCRHGVDLSGFQVDENENDIVENATVHEHSGIDNLTQFR